MAISKEQFLKAYEKHADALFRYCYFRVSDREIAKDLLQSAFFKTWEYLAGGGEIRNLKAFLYRTAHNLVIDHYRRPRTASLEKLAESGFDAEAGRGGWPADKLTGEELLRWFARLPEMYREALLLRYVEDLTVKEIAATLGESENAISVRLHRGREKLRQLLGADLNL